jgi:hypothetical protein
MYVLNLGGTWVQKWSRVQQRDRILVFFLR